MREGKRNKRDVENGAVLHQGMKLARNTVFLRRCSADIQKNAVERALINKAALIHYICYAHICMGQKLHRRIYTQLIYVVAERRADFG